jgi:hypothetical protein
VCDFSSLFIQEKPDLQTVTDGKLRITEFVRQKHHFCIARVARMNTSQKVKMSFPLLNEMISFDNASRKVGKGQVHAIFNFVNNDSIL